MKDTTVIMIAGQVADAATTALGLSVGAVELNPLLFQAPWVKPVGVVILAVCSEKLLRQREAAILAAACWLPVVLNIGVIAVVLGR
jgi:hypothetical protein